MSDIKAELKNRILDSFPKEISCDDGWLLLLTELHEAMCEIDPNYRLYQVKEKFGGLCFYYAISNPELFRKVRDLVSFYEDLSLGICEVTGKPGTLMIRNGVYKTLNESFKDEGWEETNG